MSLAASLPARTPGLPLRRRGAPGLPWWRPSWAGLLVPLGIVLLWQIAASLHWMSPNVLPPPAAVVRSLTGLIASGELWAHLSISLRRVVYGFAIGSVAGLLIGVALGFSRTIDAWFGPIFRTFAQIPSLTWIPLLMMVLGIGETLKIVVLAKASLVPVAITTAAGIRDVSADYVEVGRILRLPRVALFTKIIFPAAFPSIFSGLRQGLAGAWTALIIVEMMASANGIGYLMNWARLLFQLDVVMAAVVVVGLVGFGLDLVLRRIDLRLQAWRE